MIASVYAGICGEFPRAIRLMARNVLHPELLITDRLPLREIGAAFARLDGADPRAIKVVLDVQQV